MSMYQVECNGFVKDCEYVCEMDGICDSAILNHIVGYFMVYNHD